MKANPGYKWCPTTSKPVKSPSCPPVTNHRKKVWSFSSNSTKDSTTAKKVPKSDSMPQLNFAMAGVYNSSLVVQWQHDNMLDCFCNDCHDLSDPTKMGGLSMLLLAGEHALTNREVGHCSSVTLTVVNNNRAANPSVVSLSRSLPALKPVYLTPPAKGTPFQGMRKRCVLFPLCAVYVRAEKWGCVVVLILLTN